MDKKYVKYHIIFETETHITVMTQDILFVNSRSHWCQVDNAGTKHS